MKRSKRRGNKKKIANNQLGMAAIAVVVLLLLGTLVAQSNDLEFRIASYDTRAAELEVAIEVADAERAKERYTCIVDVKGGGKWKRIILRAADFKGEISSMPLQNFFDGSALAFDCAGEEKEFAVTNILWL